MTQKKWAEPGSVPAQASAERDDLLGSVSAQVAAWRDLLHRVLVIKGVKRTESLQ